MAMKPKSFRLPKGKKEIVLYSNVEQSEAEKGLIKFYLESGYTPKIEVKKKTKTIVDIRKELEKDNEALTEFNKIYKAKDGGFFKAMKYYNEWKNKSSSN